MGNKISRWAERQLPKLSKPSDKLVLMVLAVDADNTGVCPPETSISNVAARCRLSRSVASDALSRLREAGVLVIELQQREDGGNANSSYRLTVTPVPILGTGVVRKSVQGQPENRYTPSPISDPPVPEIGTPVTCENVTPVPILGTATSSLPPSEVVVPRAGATRAHTRAYTRDAHEATTTRNDDQPTNPRRQKLDDLNATATHPETRRLIVDWQAGHHTAVSGRLVKQMTEIVDRAVRDARDLDCLAAALREWNCRSDLYSPKVLPGLYDDAVSRKNAGESPDRPLIDENGMPRIDPQQIPDSYLTREVVDAALGGRDPAQAPPYPPDDDAYGPDGTGYDEAGLVARRAFYARWADERLVVRRAELRRVMIRAWNRKHETTVAS